MENLEELTELAKQAEKILKEELAFSKLPHDFAEVRVYNIKSVGVQGDDRSYSYPAEITLYSKENFVYEPKIIEKISSRITNEVANISRVLIVIGKNDSV